MKETEIGQILLILGVLVCLAHILGSLSSYLKQPRLIGEIFAGVLVGPFVLGKVAPSFFDTLFVNNGSMDQVLGLVYWLGLLSLMFISGSQVRNLMSRENRRPTTYILGIGKPLAFLIVIILGIASAIPVNQLIGDKGTDFSLLLIIACAVAVTSIPVISRIFQELKIMETRFASLVLGVAVLEDIALWAIVSVATSQAISGTQDSQSILLHASVNLLYLIAGLTLFPKLLKLLNDQRRNILYKDHQVAYALIITSVYIGLASALGVSLVFAAFLAGFGIVGGAKDSERKHFKDTISVISKYSFAVLIPLYFLLVGYRLVFNNGFSISMLLVFLIGSSIISVSSIGLSTMLAGFKKLDTINLSLTLNARGGPGIVLSSIAFEAGIINAAFYTTLVLTALITSQIAGSWLQYVLSKKLPLLST